MVIFVTSPWEGTTINIDARADATLALGVPRADVEDDLRHVIRTARATGYTVRLLPARCKACGFEFGEDKLGKPGKCPACRGSRIYEAQVHIDRNAQR